MSAAVENRGPQLLGIDITFTGVVVIASLLRCYVRTRIVKAFGIDDWLMAIAAISFTLYCAFSVTGVHYGTGQHQSNLAPQDIQLAKKYWWLCYVFYCTTMISSKMSIGYFLLRITATRTHSWIIYISMMFTVVTGAVFIFVAIFQCSPVSYFWNQYEGQSGTCLNIEAIIALSFVYSAINVFVDFSFALLPAFLVWGLQLDKKTKIAIIPLLAMGCIASSAVVARLGYIMNFRNPDFLWATVDIAIWSTVEQGLAITAGCLATLRPLLKRIIYRLGWSEPSAMRPSGYGPQLGNAISSRSKGSRGALASLNLTTITRTKEEDCDIKPSPAVGYPPGTCYQSSFVSSRSDWPSGMETVNASESQEELRRVEASPNELPDDASRGVVVTKTWVVTEGKHDV